AAALAVGLAVRVLRLLRDPLIHPDGPAYLGLASGLLHGKVLAALGGYYSPLYPAAVAGLAASGLRLELAGRATALLAGLAALPLVHALVRRLAGERAADAAVVRASARSCATRVWPWPSWRRRWLRSAPRPATGSSRRARRASRSWPASRGRRRSPRPRSRTRRRSSRAWRRAWRGRCCTTRRRSGRSS